MKTFVITMLFWNNAEDHHRAKNVFFSWQQLKRFSTYASKKGLPIKSYLYDFSAEKTIADSIHIATRPNTTSEFKKSSKINRVLESINIDSPYYYALIDADIFISEIYYDELIDHLLKLTDDIFYVFRVSDITNSEKTIHFETQAADYNSIQHTTRTYLNDTPSLGGLFFVSYPKLMDLGGFDERYTGWGGEDDDMAFRLQKSGLACKTIPIPAFHLPHQPALHSKQDAQYLRQVALLRAASLPTLQTDRKIAVFITFPLYSHYLPCFPICENLKEQGYDIVFCGGGADRSFILERGYYFYPLDYLPENNIKTVKAFLGVFIKSALDNKFIKNEYKDFLKSVHSFERLLLLTKLSLVFINEHLSYYHYFIPKYIPRYIINTKLSTKKHRGIAPINTSYVPFGIFLLDAFVAEVIWQKEIAKNSLKKLFKKFAFLGKDDAYLFGHYFKNGKRNGHIAAFTNKNALYDGLKDDVQTLILCPEQLEYTWKNRGYHERYFNLPIQQRSISLTEEEKKAYEVVKAKILALKANQYQIILCAMGSTAGGYAKICYPFFERLIQATQSLPNVVLLIATGKGVHLTELYGNNVFTLPIVPQIDVLSYADVLVCHGGMNTIREGIEYEIPMLVYPMNVTGDNPGNAARIAYHKLGLKGNIKRDSIHQIKSNVQRLLSDNMIFKHTLQNFKQLENKHYTRMLNELIQSSVVTL